MQLITDYATAQPWSLSRISASVLRGAQRLAEERHNGKNLRDLPERWQRDLSIDAADQLAWYKERHS